MDNIVGSLVRKAVRQIRQIVLVPVALAGSISTTTWIVLVILPDNIQVIADGRYKAIEET